MDYAYKYRLKRLTEEVEFLTKTRDEYKDTLERYSSWRIQKIRSHIYKLIFTLVVWASGVIYIIFKANNLMKLLTVPVLLFITLMVIMSLEEVEETAGVVGEITITLEYLKRKIKEYRDLTDSYSRRLTEAEHKLEKLKLLIVLKNIVIIRYEE